MLKHLEIKHIAVIESVSLSFDSGFTALTGETGAGKSIIIGALGLLRGERFSKDMIRTGEKSARVDGLFEVDEETAQLLSEQFGIEAEDGEVLLSRTMDVDGKNTVRIGGAPATLSMLREVGTMLTNIHGQHDNATLLSRKTHIRLLDKHGGSALAHALEEYRLLHNRCTEAEQTLSRLKFDEQEIARRLDMLEFQMDEIDTANLKVGEEEELTERRNFLANSQKIASGAERAYECLYGGEGSNAHDLLWEGINALEDIIDYDKSLAALHATLSEMGYGLTDAVRGLKQFSGSLTYDVNELDDIETRLEQIALLKRKYGATVELILEYYNNICAERDTLVNADERIAALEEEVAQLRQERTQAADKLTGLRKEAAKRLEEGVAASLADLDMKKTVFAVEITPCDCREDGCDEVEFLISANVGEVARPLAKIASGGELSRIMLSIKSTLSGADGALCEVFDEVDTGVSGRAAQKLGEKLCAMSRGAQVVCITHLPQIAALADSHVLIEKQVDGDRTHTRVYPLSRQERVEEIARMLGGAVITDITRRNAEELLTQAEEIKGGLV